MIKVAYSDKQNSNPFDSTIGFTGIISPSSGKPRQMASALAGVDYVELFEPRPVLVSDFKLCHDNEYVDGVMGLTRNNGFGTKSQSVCDSLPYTVGAMYDAALAAKKDVPAAALVSGFHHAGYSQWEHFGHFCTFNGLMVTAMKLLMDGCKNVAIIDCDMHIGNGTDNILDHLPHLRQNINHISLGYLCTEPAHAEYYLRYLNNLDFGNAIPDVILYQSGADVHVNDPYGGVLTTEQMIERDEIVFKFAKSLQIPLVWNLAGGYQVGPNGEVNTIIDLHMNTFKAAKRVYEL